MRFLFIITLALFLVTNSAKADEAPIVIELFTSQSCSSCPPADRLLAKLAKQEHVIALSCHVTYWNHLHWKDTLSQPFCTDRQQSYNSTLNEGIFTPQMVINGSYSAVGSRSRTVHKALDIAKENPIKPLTLTQTEHVLSVNEWDDYQGKNTDFLLFTSKSIHAEDIKSGENRGRHIVYTNPVTDIQPLQKNSINLLNSNDFVYSVLVQDTQSGAILAAGQYRP